MFFNASLNSFAPIITAGELATTGGHVLASKSGYNVTVKAYCTHNVSLSAGGTYVLAKKLPIPINKDTAVGCFIHSTSQGVAWVDDGGNLIYQPQTNVDANTLIVGQLSYLSMI